MGKVIYWELYKKLKFDRTTKFYFHKSESVLDNEMYEFLCDFAIQSEHLIPTRRPNLMIITKKKKKKKRTCHILDFTIPMDH